MSDQYPNQQPGFQPVSGSTPSGAPGYHYSQQPPTYGPQPGYGQQPPQPGYGQPQQGYYGASGAVPPGFIPMPQKPTRPGVATGASVMGIITGSLGIVMGFALLGALSTAQGVSSVLRIDDPTYLVTGYIQTFATFGAAAGLLAGGISFLKGRGYKILTVSAGVQLALVVWGFISTLLNMSTLGAAGRDAATGAIPLVLAGLGLGISILVCLINPASKQWRDLNAQAR